MGPIIPRDLNSSGSTTVDRVIKGVLYVIGNEGEKPKAQIMNMSFGFPPAANSEALQSVIKKAQEKGIVVVSAAGNDSTDAPIMPCSYASVVCVAAHASDGSIAEFSNYGSWVDLAAPGLSILSTYPHDRAADFYVGLRFTDKPGWEYKDGTSM